MTQPHCSDRTDSPSLSLSELLCMLQQMYINTGKSICSLMLIYARTALPRQPLWPAHMNNFNAKGFTLPTDFTVVKYVVESWQLRSLSLTAPPLPQTNASRAKVAFLEELSLQFWSSDFKTTKTHMWSEPGRSLDRKRDIRIRFRSPSPHLWQSVRRSAYLYLWP